MKFDLHIHSNCSYDSFSNPSKIIKVAKNKGLDVISITDHDTLKAYKKFEQYPNIAVICGMEIKTDMGDLIGLFLNDEIKSKIFFDVVDEIRSQNGLIVLPHPFRRKCDPNSLIEYVDLIEVINARSSCIENTNAWKLSQQYDKKPITGSDAHSYFEIGITMTEIDGYFDDLDILKKILLNNGRKCYGSTNYFSHCYSFLASKIKKLGWK